MMRRLCAPPAHALTVPALTDMMRQFCKIRPGLSTPLYLVCTLPQVHLHREGGLGYLHALGISLSFCRTWLLELGHEGQGTWRCWEMAVGLDL